MTNQQNDLTMNKTKQENTEKSTNQSEAKVNGNLTYDDKVVQKIIGTAIEQIDGLLDVNGGFFSNIADKLINTDNVTSGINTEVGEKQVAVDMDVVVEYGRDIPKIAERVKQVIHDEVKHMTHLDVIEVNINVVDIKTEKEYEEDSETVQDKVTSAAKATGQFASKQTNKAKNAITSGTNKAQDKIEDAREPRVQ